MAGRAFRFLGGYGGSYGSGCQVPCKTTCLFVSSPASQFFTMMRADARDVLQLRKVGWDKEQLFDLQVDTCQMRWWQAIPEKCPASTAGGRVSGGKSAACWRGPRMQAKHGKAAFVSTHDLFYLFCWRWRLGQQVCLQGCHCR